MSDAHTARLLALANDQSSVPNDVSLPNWLAPILTEAKASSKDRTGLAPRFERLNASGRFIFRGYRL
jgi:hypothetical protein